MPYLTFPAYSQIGVAVTATISAFNGGTGDFSFTVGANAYNANWNTDVLANLINTIGRSVGSHGRLNLRAAKAANLRLSGWQSAGSNYGGTDYATYTAFNATVRAVNGTTVTLVINATDYQVDWSNPASVWTGAETTIVPNVGSAGTVRIGDAFGRSQGLGAQGKWPDNLRGSSMVDMHVKRVGEGSDVVVLDAGGAPVVDSRGQVVTWRLPDGDPQLAGFDRTSQQPQTVQIHHLLKARLAMP